MRCRYPNALLVTVSLFVAGSGVRAFEPREITEEERIQREAPGARFRGLVRITRPNVELPDHVDAKEGQLTVFADYANVGEKGVPIYVVNRTDETVSFPCQDNNIYLMLEFRDKDGHWVRAQNQLGSDCGLSYYSMSLLPGQHFQPFGYAAKGGKKAPVRYRIYSRSPVVSNVGEGRYTEADRIAASLDSLNQLIAPKPLIMLVGHPTAAEGNVDPTPREYVAALQIFSQYRESAYIRRAAERHVQRLPAGSVEAKAIHKILARKWPRGGDELKLFGLCAAIVAGAGDQPIPGLSDVQRSVAWKTIAALLSDHLSKRAETEWRALTRTVFELLPAGIESPDAEVSAAASGVLGVASLGDEYVANDQLFKWVQIDHPDVIEVSAAALSRRRKWHELSDLTFEFPPDKLPIVLAAMVAQPGRPKGIRRPEGRRETAFWKQCAKKQPIETARRLTRYVNSAYYNPLTRFLHPPLREFLSGEVKRAQAEGEKAGDWKHLYGVAEVVKFVGAWRKKEDVELLQELLKHPGHTSSIGTSGEKKFDYRYYKIREMAKEALKAMDVPVSDDILVRETIVLSEGGGRSKPKPKASVQKDDPFSLD